MGTLRFFLAVMVALSHVGWYPFGLNLGVAAVMVFYMISGFAMSALWEKINNKSCFGVSLRNFYYERFLRIFPAYFFVLFVSSLFIYIYNPESYFLQKGFGVSDFFQNLFIVPLNFYMYTGIDQFTIIPPAWSLAVELQFYILLPFFLYRYPNLFWWISLMVLLFAQSGWILTEYWSYRLLPGVLHLFLVGVLLYRAQKNGYLFNFLYNKILIYSVFLLMAYWMTKDGLPRDGGLMHNYLYEFSVALIPGIVVLAILINIKKSLSWDRWLGNLAYGTFLSHFLVYWYLQVFKIEFSMLTYLVLSILVASIVYLIVEQPIGRLRKRIYKHS